MERTNESVLHDVQCLLVDADDIAAVCEIACSFLERQTGVAALSISIAARYGGGLRVHAAPNVLRVPTAIEKHAHVLASLERSQAIPAADVHSDEHGWLLGEGWRASRQALYVPLVAHGASVGFLSLHTDGDSSQLDSHLPMIQSFASFLGIIADKALNLEELSETKAIWESTLDSIADLVVLTSRCGNLIWINQAAAHHLFGDAGGWFDRHVSEIPLLRPLAGMYEEGGAHDQPLELTSELPDPENSRQRYRVRSRRVVSPETGRTRFVHVLRFGDFAYAAPMPAVPREEKAAVPSGLHGFASGIATPETYQVLLIDDEAMLARALSRGLAAIGHLVTSYGSGHGVLNEEPGVLQGASLAIVDMRLPDMEGIELAALLHARNPRLRFILTSGLQIAPELLDTIKAPRLFLHKPFRLDALLRAMNEVMAQPSA
ncbi:MAG: two-component system, NtrC family, C4-dicarboxylate transport response regulator DctD [Candidatus Sumerlaeota bacterium]|nr:two-component system, NtrC family, C4-dicarboxylate transport response regulator DctD [Candidatus Sumerlaeota bacterium]